MKVKEHYMAGRKVVLKFGNLARLWMDPCGEKQPLCTQFPILFSVCNDQEITVAKFRENVEVNFFRRRLNPELLAQWKKVHAWVRALPLSNDPDQVVWALGGKKYFTTKSVYKYLERNITGCNFRWIWEAKIPLKIQIFLWQLFQDSVLTREVMRRRGWLGRPACDFCNKKETSNHLFFTCPVARDMWRKVG